MIFSVRGVNLCGDISTTAREKIMNMGMSGSFLVSSMTDAAYEAARIVQSREHLKAHSKGEVGNIVTAADEKSEKRIKDILRDIFPKCVFLAEESEATISRENFAEHELVFVIDPIDGTTNYKYGIPSSAISIGAWNYGKPIAAVVYDLVNDDIYTATVGGGVIKNAKRMVNKNIVTDLKKAIADSDWGYADTPKETVRILNRLAANVMAVRILGSAVMSLVFAATGQYTCYIHNTMKPFDVGAAVLMLQELGLMVTNWDGEPYSIFDEKIIVAPPHLHNEFCSLSLGS